VLFVIIGYDAPDAKDKRPQHRPAHLRHLGPLAQAGTIILAGHTGPGTLTGNVRGRPPGVKCSPAFSIALTGADR